MKTTQKEMIEEMAFTIAEINKISPKQQISFTKGKGDFQSLYINDRLVLVGKGIVRDCLLYIFGIYEGIRMTKKKKGGLVNEKKA